MLLNCFHLFVPVTGITGGTSQSLNINIDLENIEDISEKLSSLSVSFSLKVK
jgi:hypothetical protein